MRKKIFICVIVLIILTIASLFLVKFIRINNFFKKVQENFSTNNFQFELVKNDNTTIHKYLKKDSTLLIIPNENVKLYTIDNGDNTFSTLTIDEKNKVVSKSVVENPENITLSGDLKSDYSFFEKIKLCFNWKIKYEQVDGIKCIVITDENNNTTYYNEENAYMIKNEDIGEIINIQLNSVTEEDIRMPNLEEYIEN